MAPPGPAPEGVTVTVTAEPASTVVGEADRSTVVVLSVMPTFRNRFFPGSYGALTAVRCSPVSVTSSTNSSSGFSITAS